MQKKLEAQRMFDLNKADFWGHPVIQAKFLIFFTKYFVPEKICHFNSMPTGSFRIFEYRSLMNLFGQKDKNQSKCIFDFFFFLSFRLFFFSPKGVF